jgi:predicted secreted hydrolase
MNVSDHDFFSLIVSNKNGDDWREYPYDVGKLHFPRDEGIHDFKHEWWYLNLHLVNLESNRKYDVMLTYFPKQDLLPVSVRYFMITDRSNSMYSPLKTFTLGSIKVSDKKQDIRFRKGLRFDSWVQLETGFAFEYEVNVNDGRNGLFALMRLRRPPLPVNGEGYVPSGIGGYSYYYSLTRLNVAGYLKLDNKNIPVVGICWVDHQFGDYHQTDQTETYDWFCLQLDNNVDIICWYAYANGKLVNPIMTYMLSNNKVEIANDSFKIETLDYWLSPQLFKYGSKWRITEKKHKLDVTVSPVIPNQLSYAPYPFEVKDKKRIYLVGLYEGSTIVEGTFAGKPVKGLGYAELTHIH